MARMPLHHRVCLLLLSGCALSAWAADPVEPAPRSGEPKVENKVAEDDQVRIEELRVRGAVQQVTVHNKKGSAPDYQIVLPRAGRDGARERDAAGQRVWRLISF